MPIIIEASWVTIKHRMWILAAGGADVVAEVLGAAEVVAEDEFSPRASPEAKASPEFSAMSGEVALSDGWDGEGVEAAVSSMEAGASTIFTSPAVDAAVAEPKGTCVCESSEFDVAPVLARLCCFCCSLSEGERERFRVESASGMVANSVFFSVHRRLCQGL